MYEELRNLAESDLYPFHMPGHKRQTADDWLRGAFRLDITEIDGFDNLHYPEGLIRKLEERLERVFGGDRAKLLINGSTGGVLAAISAALPRGGKLLMSRNSHLSACHAVELRGLEVSWLMPEEIPGWGICGGIRPEEVERALARDPEIRAVFLTSPTYEGVVSDVEGIAAVCRKRALPLIVDSAHGAHFGLWKPFTEEFHCPDAWEAGADIVIESLHKTLPAFTQTAMALCREGRVDLERFFHYLRVYQTSSPSYLFLAGADRCLDFLQEEGDRAFGKLELELRELREFTERLPGLRIAGKELLGSHGVSGIDPTKLLLACRGRSGRELYEAFRRDCHLQPEMAAGKTCLLMTSLMDTGEGFRRLREAMRELDRQASCSPDDPDPEWNRIPPVRRAEAEREADPGETSALCGEQEIPEPVSRLSIGTAAERDRERIPLSQAAGRTAAGYVFAYPPGIPVLVPGEVITEALAECLRQRREQGTRLYGMEEDGIYIVREPASMGQSTGGDEWISCN